MPNLQQQVASNPFGPAIGAASKGLGMLGGLINKGTSAFLGNFPKAVGTQAKPTSQYAAPVGPSLPSIMGAKAKSPSTSTTTPDNTIASQFKAPAVSTTPSNSSSIVNIPNAGGGFTGYASGYTPANQPPTNAPQPLAPVQGPTTLPGMLLAQGASAAQSIPGAAAPGLQQFKDISQNIADIRRQAALGEAANTTGGLMAPIAQGRAQAIAGTEAQQEAALGAQQQAALTGAQTAANVQQAGAQELGSLAGTAGTQVQAPYGTPLFNPITGQFTTPGSSVGGGGLDPQSQGSQLAKLVTSAQMDFPTANAQITNQYGVAGSNALRQAILAANPSFNFNLSASSAQTQATGQQARTAIQPASQALDALQEAFNNLPSLEQTNIPIINQLTQAGSMASGLGRTATSNFTGALQEARSRIDAVLAPIIGVDAAKQQSQGLLPDNMVPSEIPSKIAYAKYFMQNQVDAYVGSGQQSGGATSSPGGSTAPSPSGASSDNSLYQW